MGLLDFIFGNSKKEQILDFVSRGAKVIDVRSNQEFKNGNAKNSINIPLPELDKNISKIKAMNAPIIVICQSGGRAGMACSQLKNKGVECLNAGNWKNVSI